MSGCDARIDKASFIVVFVILILVTVLVHYFGVV